LVRLEDLAVQQLVPKLAVEGFHDSVLPGVPGSIKSVLTPSRFSDSRNVVAVKHAPSDTVIPIDADLQDRPEVIEQRVEKWQEDFDMVYATRRIGSGESWCKRATVAAFYRVLGRVFNEIKVRPLYFVQRPWPDRGASPEEP
jgi:hypothetical protein